MPLDEASIYAAWRVANLKFCTEKSLPPLAGEGGRRPEGGDKKLGFIPLGEPSIYAAWRAQYLRCLAGPVFAPLGGPTPYQSSATTVKDVCYGMGKAHINKKHLQMAFTMVTIHADTETL